MQLTESFLSLINPEKEKEEIGSFVYQNKNYQLWRLYTKQDLQVESKTLGHCVGDTNTYYFKISGNNPKFAIISLRHQDQAEYTIEFDLQKKSIRQFRGGSNRPVNSLPKNHTFVTSTLTSLESAGLKVESIEEEFPFWILRNQDQYSVVNALSLNYLLRNPEMEVIKGEITLPPSTHFSELEFALSKPGLIVNVSSVPAKFKSSIKIVRSHIIDISESINYDNLESVSGNALFPNLRSVKSFPKLISVGGNLSFPKLKKADGFEKLQYIGGSPSFNALSVTERLKIPALASLDRCLRTF